jgi:molybdate transport repressor ModE-like protein
VRARAEMSGSAERLTHLLRTRLKVKQLVVLSAIAEQGSIHRAAAAHGMSQPALSKIVKEIEDILEMPLFEREHSGIRLTHFGERLIFRARSLLTDLDQAAFELAAIKDGYRASLRVGVIPLLSPVLLVKAMNILQQGGKRYTFQISVGSADVLIDALRARKLDCALARSPTEPIEDLHCRKLYEQTPFLVAHRESMLWSCRPPVRLFELAECSWILPPRPTPIRETVERIFLQAQLKPPVPAVECFDPTIIRALLEARHELIAILPKEITEDLASRNGLLISPIEEQVVFPDVCFISLGRMLEDPVLGHFVAALECAIEKGGD